MNQIPQIKTFVLRALKGTNGQPLPGNALEAACLSGVFPRPVLSDVTDAIHELETDGYIIGAADDVSETINWALTPKGTLRAKQI